MLRYGSLDLAALFASILKDNICRSDSTK